MTKATVNPFQNRIIGYGTKPADQFQANALNYRKHPQRQRDAVQASLRDLGWIGVVVENKRTGNLIDGHERVWQALQRNEDVPYIEVDLSEEEERLALAVFDPITNMAEIDAAILDELLQQVNTGEAALQQVLADLADSAGLYGDKGTEGDTAAQTDRAEELRQLWQVEPGQMWQCGEHRIICGDCTDPATVARLMGGERAALVVTDPPYGVDYEGGRNPDSNVPRTKLAGDKSGALYGECMTATIPYCDDSAAWYLWFAGTVGKPVYEAVSAAGYTVRAMIVWNKLDAHYGNFMAQYMQKHEPCLYCVKKPPVWNGPTNEVTVWDVKQPTKNEYHPTEKPTELIERAIRNSSDKGAIVADWFSGSGTTLIACENLSRRCRAVEISPAYVAVALQRYQDHTQRTPTLIDTLTP